MSVRTIDSDISEWVSLGRASERWFFATTDEIQSWLNAALPAQYAPYQLVGFDILEVERRKYRREAFVCEPSGFLECARAGPDRHSFYIWSPSLTPGLPIEGRARIETVWALNGLVELSLGFEAKNGTEAASISASRRVQNTVTGEVRTYPGYQAVFRSLDRAIAKDTVYSVMRRFGDSVQEDTSWSLMTQGAAAAARDGFPYAVTPGRLIR